MRGNIYSKASRITLRHSPFPVAAMRYHLIRLTPFGTFPSRGRLCVSATVLLSAESQASP